jgi:hypothetical protein
MLGEDCLDGMDDTEVERINGWSERLNNRLRGVGSRFVSFIIASIAIVLSALTVRWLAEAGPLHGLLGPHISKTPSAAIGWWLTNDTPTALAFIALLAWWLYVSLKHAIVAAMGLLLIERMSRVRFVAPSIPLIPMVTMAWRTFETCSQGFFGAVPRLCVCFLSFCLSGVGRTLL